MSLKFFIIFFLFCIVNIFLIPTILKAQNINNLTICTDSNSWYPFTFVKNENAQGIHIDIVKKACNEIGIRCTFSPLPWKRCLYIAKRGLVDGIVSASYNENRNKYLFYPPDSLLYFLGTSNNLFWGSLSLVEIEIFLAFNSLVRISTF